MSYSILSRQDYFNLDDFENRVRKKCLAFDDVLSCFRKVRIPCSNQHATLFVLDCCWNEAYKAGAIAERCIEFKSGIRGKGLSAAINNSILIFSTCSGAVATDEQPSEGGPFMNSFHQEIMHPGLGIHKVLMNVRCKLAGTQLVPDTSLLTDEFFFCNAEEDVGPMPPMIKKKLKGAKPQRDLLLYLELRNLLEVFFGGAVGQCVGTMLLLSFLVTLMAVGIAHLQLRN